MSTERYDIAVQPRGRSAAWRQGWSLVTALLAVGVFLQAASAGAMLSGVDWARAAHAATASLLIAATSFAGLYAIATLRRVPQGRKLAWSLLAQAVVLGLQAATGALAAKGANLLWVHVPLGVALFGFAVRAAVLARALREA